MKSLADISIKFKLMMIILFSSSIVLFMSTAVFVSTDLIIFRRNMVENLSTLAEVIGNSCTAALVFKDREAVEEILATLKAVPNIISVQIHTKEGKLFVIYVRPESDPESAEDRRLEALTDIALEDDNPHWERNYVGMAKRIVLDGETIGRIHIQSDLKTLQFQLKLYACVAGGVILLATLITYLLSAKLQRIISDPILQLAQTMKRVSTAKKYTIRSQKQGDDEIGLLIDGFNEMLTQIQQRDRKLERHREKLEDQVAARTAELTATNQELKNTVLELKNVRKAAERAEKMEMVGTLAGGVAHDLNNVLSAIVSYPELLLMKLEPHSPMKKPLLTIQKAGEKAAAIVQDLLTLARRGVAVKEVTNLNRIITEYLDSPEHAKLLLYHSSVDVKTDIESRLMNIIGSPVHLSKTVMNLVSNAAEGMPDGGEVIIATENRYIDTPVQGYDDVQEGDYVVLSISDTGIGIAEEDRNRIFEPFYTKKKMGRSGTGLGLAVVWGALKDHHGYIEVRNRKDKGTRFILFFPATRNKRRKVEDSRTIEQYMGKGESILVVDDVRDQREIATNMLTTLGYRVTTVSSGEDAVEYVKKTPADLILLDMIMDPGIDGLETYRRIVTLRPSQKAVIASGFSETERIKKAHEIGAGAYIKKPYLIEKIGMTIRAELEK